MIDMFLVLIVAAVTWSVASEGAWGSVFNFFSVVFAGLIATNYFEPLAAIMQPSLPRGDWAMRADYLAFMGLFAGLVFLFRLITDKIVPDLMEIHPLAYDIIRWITAVATGYATMAILLTSLHLTALPRNFIGFTPERANFLNMDSPDRRWLGFVQYNSEHIFRRGPKGPIFDGPIYSVGNGQPQEVWSSFIIRYASRRENARSLAGGNDPSGDLSTSPSLSTPQPTPGKRPAGGMPAF